ncbi:MAG: tetratricopeptide repeat protein [Ferruginibacter sp.]
MLKPKPNFYLFILFLICYAFTSQAQPTWTINPFGTEKKPAQYEEKKLASEKTGDKKLTAFRKLIQNNVTHYNFYFNANNKLNTVLERAKLSQQDDYTKLLSFYPYSLDNTAAQKTELDSVIYKATAGILLHDLRTDWVDNLYLLIGKAYYLRKEFDSAALTFQFINYNLFPRKKQEDDDRIVGSSIAARPGYLSIANKEKRNIAQKILTLPPSRNDALIWLIKVFTSQTEYSDAAGLINILQNDPNLPGRLKNDLEEVTAFWFYSQNNYDSAAVHLEKALSNAGDKEDKSRWEFLLAQLYELNKNFDKASSYYNKVSRHTINPVMDIYARLNDAKMMRNNGNYKELQNSIDHLLGMAKKDKYEEYRDIIYYSAGQLSMQKPDTLSALGHYGKSVHYNENNIIYRNKSFYQLADIAFTQKRYEDAHSFYDSLDLSQALNEIDAEATAERKSILIRLVQNLNAISREDSLQRIAALPNADREAFVKKLAKQYRKENGLKEEDDFTGNTLITFNNNNAGPADLFTGPVKGEWYFYNTGLRSRGFSDFRAKWGRRENIDNWRRKSAGSATSSKGPPGTTNPLASDPADPLSPANANNVSIPKTADFSFEGLMGELPLSPERIDSSNKTIATGLLANAKIFQNELFDYEQAVSTYNEYLRRFPGSKDEPEIYLGLYYSYLKLGNKGQAGYYKNVVTTKYPGTNYSNMISNPAAMEPNKKNPEVTARYESIYDMFIEGNFAAAVDAKQKADSVHGKNYWSPQLLYIEAAYYIKEKNDSSAIAILNNLQTLYPTSPLKDKAVTMVDVLGRRKEIENYLTNLQVTRVEEDKIIISDDQPAVVVKTIDKPEEVKQVQNTVLPRILKDSAILTPSIYKSGSFSLEVDKPQFVAMILDKVDGVYINEAKNAFNRFNRESNNTQNIIITRDVLDAQRVLLLFAPFEDATNALKYYDKIKKAAPSEISWLPANKYSFLIISDNNLQILKTNKDLQSYKQLLITNFGNKF